MLDVVMNASQKDKPSPSAAEGGKLFAAQELEDHSPAN